MKFLLAVFITIFSSTTQAGQFSAGFAKIDITPIAGKDKAQTLAAGTKVIDHIYDPLYAKSLVISDGNRKIAFIALDLLYLLPSDFDKLLMVLRETHSFDQIFLSVTHTHSGHVATGKFSTLQDKINRSLTEAVAALEPVSIGAAKGSLPEVYNRRVHLKNGTAEMVWTNPEREPGRPVDDTVGVINIRASSGATLVNIVNYRAHPVITMDLHRAHVSADYPGELAKNLASQGFGDTIFLLGAAGDINPFDADTKPIEQALENSALLGSKLASVVVDSLNGMRHQSSGQFRFETHRQKLPLKTRSLFAPDLTTAHSEINTLLLTNDIALASFSGEFFSDFGTILKAQSPSKHTFFLGYTNGTLGYVPTREDILFGGYGADGSSNNFSPDLGHEQIEWALKSLHRLHQAKLR